MLEDEGDPFFVPYEYIVWLQNVTITSDTLSDLYSRAANNKCKSSWRMDSSTRKLCLM